MKHISKFRTSMKLEFQQENKNMEGNYFYGGLHSRRNPS